VRAPFAGLFGEGRRRRALWALALLTLAFGVAALPSLDTMDEHGVGIIELEFVGTSEKAQELYTDLGAEGRDAARTSLYLDYPYLVCYGLFLAGACTAVSTRARALGWARAAGAGALLAWGSLLAAGFDALENAALLLVLGDHTGQPWPAIATASASAKFALAIAASLYVLGGIVATMVARRRRRASA
jgi:hypothetical protein